MRNIEHLLSVIEMKDILAEENQKEKFIQFIKDVIKAYTPQLSKKSPYLMNWYDTLFSTGSNCEGDYYGAFVASLQHLQIKVDKSLIKRDEKGNAINPLERFVVGRLSNEVTDYSVLILNYDLVLEQVCDFLNSLTTNGQSFNFLRPTKAEEVNNENLLIKLHGSITDEIFVLPTWNKSISNGSSTVDWQIALRKLSQAHSIRILGYSLPETDYYLQYLFEAAASLRDMENLESIDILCLDDRSDSVHERYGKFISSEHQEMRFVNRDIKIYLKSIFKKRDFSLDTSGGYIVKYKNLEEVHENFFKENAR